MFVQQGKFNRNQPSDAERVPVLTGCLTKKKKMIIIIVGPRINRRGMKRERRNLSQEQLDTKSTLLLLSVIFFSQSKRNGMLRSTDRKAEVPESKTVVSVEVLSTGEIIFGV